MPQATTLSVHPNPYAALDAKALRYGRVDAGASVDGCLYFREAAYRSARLSLIDTETGEKEGMIVGF